MSNITQKWVSVLEAFSQNYKNKLSASEIARKVNIPQQTTSRVLNQLVKENLIQFQRQGRNKLFYLNTEKINTKNIIKIIELEKTRKFLQRNKVLTNLFEELIKEFKTIIIFGSYASNTNDENSDLDIMLIGKEKSIRQIKEKYVVEINEQIISKKEFKKLKKSPLIKEIIMNHILIGNQEEIIEELL